MMFIHSGLAGGGAKGLELVASGEKGGESRRGRVVLARKGCTYTLTLVHHSAYSSTHVALSLKTR